MTTHETKAARLLALYRLQSEGQLAGLSDIRIGQILGMHRITVWRDRQAMKRADELHYSMIKLLEKARAS